MRKYGKKILGIVAAATMFCSVAVASGCGDSSFKAEAPNPSDYAGEVSSNGGFAVEKGNYVYFINGAESNTADNTYGEVEKGALMRITKAQLAAKDYGKATVVVPSLFVAKNYEAGIFIYGDYVYYATPTTEKNLEGKVENGYIDFKRAKLDGSEAPMKDKYFHLSSNSSFYRFVEVDGVVYCLYEESGALKSFNTKTRTHTVLVEGASSYFYDKKDLENGNVYYTMPVTYGIDQDTTATASYNQIYCVNAAATVTSVGKKADGKIGYTATGVEADGDGTYSKEYTFSESYLKNYDGFEAKDHASYPYVNLGQLVLDGVGKAADDAGWFNEDFKVEDCLEIDGYTYTLTRYENGGVYFTRNTDGKLYYLSDARGETWNTVTANDAATTAALDVVANNTAKASTSALYEVKEENGVRTHSYLYVSGSVLSRATTQANGEADVVTLSRSISSATLWKTEGEYLYYYASYNNGNNLSRIKYTGEQADYNLLLSQNEDKADYQPITLALVEWNSDWYKPEMFDVADGKTVVLYSNVQKYGNSGTTFNYVYAAQMGSTAEIQANVDAYDAYNEYYKGYEATANAQGLIQYYFAAGTLFSEEDLTLSQDVIDCYDDESKSEAEKDAFYREVVGKFTVAEGETKAELVTEKELIGLVGKMTDADKKLIRTAWTDSLLKPETEEDEDGLPGWAIALIIIGGVLLVAAAVTVPMVLGIRKKNAAKAEAEATVNAYKRKIDTTDDKSIDVYAENADEAVKEELSEDPLQAEEEAVEEAVEAVETAAIEAENSVENPEV